MKSISLKKAVLYLGLIAGGIFIGLLINNSTQSAHQDHGHETIADVWTCSMHPQIREDGPGDCPICGMDLVPVSPIAETVGDDEIQMTEAAAQLANIQTTKVSGKSVSKVINLQGIVKADERRLSSVTAHFDGRVEKLYADFTGQYIKKGGKLATLYSPDLVTAQKELFEAIKLKDSNPSFYESAIQKLKLWELTDAQINRIIQKGAPEFYFDVYAPRLGTIQVKNVSEGEHIMDGTVMFEIADLNRVWVLFEAYESDLSWISLGDTVSFYVSSIPGRQFKSVVTFIDPVVNKQTRTVSIRVEVSNKDDLLKPGMFAEGVILASFKASDGRLTIPKSSVLWTGERAIVYVKQPGYEQPTFQFREIQLGPDAGEYYMVEAGLTAGEEIATNGVFKIDAAAQLQGKTSMMNPEGGKIPTGHQHGDMPAGTMEESTKTGEAHPEKGASGQSPNVNETFMRQLKEIFNAYLPVKDALIEGDATKAGRMANALLAAIEKVDMSLVKGAQHDAWMKDLSVLRSATQTILQATDIEKSRAALSPLSDHLYHSLKRYEVEGLGAFRQFCPMALDFKGAYWLSDSDEILNPYFGDEMLTCGNVDDELN